MIPETRMKNFKVRQCLVNFAPVYDGLPHPHESVLWSCRFTAIETEAGRIRSILSPFTIHDKNNQIRYTVASSDNGQINGHILASFMRCVINGGSVPACKSLLGDVTVIQDRNMK